MLDNVSIIVSPLSIGDWVWSLVPVTPVTLVSYRLWHPATLRTALRMWDLAHQNFFIQVS